MVWSILATTSCVLLARFTQTSAWMAELFLLPHQVQNIFAHFHMRILPTNIACQPGRGRTSIAASECSDMSSLRKTQPLSRLVSSKGAIQSFSPALTRDLSSMYHDYAGVPQVCYASRNSAMQKLRHIIDEPMRLKPVLIGVMSGSMPFSNHASHKVVRIEPKPETGYTETYTEFLSSR